MIWHGPCIRFWIINWWTVKQWTKLQCRFQFSSMKLIFLNETCSTFQHLFQWYTLISCKVFTLITNISSFVSIIRFHQSPDFNEPQIRYSFNWVPRDQSKQCCSKWLSSNSNLFLRPSDNTLEMSLRAGCHGYEQQWTRSRLTPPPSDLSVSDSLFSWECVGRN